MRIDVMQANMWCSLLHTACKFRQELQQSGSFPRTISPTGTIKPNSWALDEIKGQQTTFVSALVQAGDSPGTAPSNKRGAVAEAGQLGNIIKRHRSSHSAQQEA